MITTTTGAAAATTTVPAAAPSPSRCPRSLRVAAHIFVRAWRRARLRSALPRPARARPGFGRSWVLRVSGKPLGSLGSVQGPQGPSGDHEAPLKGPKRQQKAG